MDNTPTPVNSQRILIVTLSGIGNFIMQSPAISLLKAKFPQSHITAWVAPRGTKILAQNHPAIDEVIEAPIKGSLSFHLNLIKTLRQHHFDIGIVLSPGQLIKSAFYLKAAGIPIRIGNSYPLNSNAHSSLFLTDAVKEDPALHDIEENIKILEPLDIHNPLSLTHYQSHIPDEANHKAQQWLTQNNLTNTFLIGIHGGSAPDFLWKRWPLPNFATVAKELVSKYPQSKILLFGGKDETEQKQQLRQLIGQDNALIVEADLLTTAALMQHCKLVIANDSGLMHLSAAVGTPTLGLFGPTDEAKTGPRGTKSYVYRASGTKPTYNTEKNYNLGGNPDASMLAITPQAVIQKAESTLNN